MNRPTDKQIEEVLAGVATPEDAKFVAEWFATEEGNTYLDAVMTREAEHLKAETAEIYVDHTIPSEKMYHQIQKNISRKQIKRICFRVAAILIPVIFLIGLYLQINSRVDLFGTTEYEEIRVAKGERIQMMFQDGTRVYINSDSWLKYPKKFGLSKREVFLVGEAYFVVAKNKKRPFIVNLNGPSVHVLGTSFDVQAYPENKDIVICLDEGHVNLTLSSAKEYPLLPGEKLIYNKESDQCRIIKNDHSKQVSMWKDNVISFKDTPLTEVVKVLNRWYNVNFKIEDEQASKYVYTLTSDNTILEKVLQDLEKIAPVKFEYDEVRKEVTVQIHPAFGLNTAYRQLYKIQRSKRSAIPDVIGIDGLYVRSVHYCHRTTGGSRRTSCNHHSKHYRCKKSFSFIFFHFVYSTDSGNHPNFPMSPIEHQQITFEAKNG